MPEVEQSGHELIAEERRRQVEVEGFTAEHDEQHNVGELAMAASCYALPPICRAMRNDECPIGWPWGPDWWKPTPDDRVRELSKAGALIVAEIDRLLRLEARNG